MAEIVRRRSWGGVLPLGRHVSITGSRSIHAPSVSIAPSSFQEEQNARHHKQFKLEQALAKPSTCASRGLPTAQRRCGLSGTSRTQSHRSAGSLLPPPSAGCLAVLAASEHKPTQNHTT